MNKITQAEFDQRVEEHARWLDGDTNAEYLSIINKDLRNVCMHGLDLRDSRIRGCDLREVDLVQSNLANSNLIGCNLSNSNLTDACFKHCKMKGVNLKGAMLWDVIGNNKQIRSLFLERYNIAYTCDCLQIGCSNNAIERWQELTEEDIYNLDGHEAVKFWRKYKDYIFKTIELLPAVGD